MRERSTAFKAGVIITVCVFLTFAASTRVNAPTQIKGGPVNVQTFGATGNGSTDDTTAISNAIAAACASAAPSVVFPPPTVSYLITSTLQLCDQIDIFGQGHPILRYAGTGAMFNLPGNINEPQIHGFQILGILTSGQVAINIQGNSGIVVQGHFFDLTILNFGDTSTHTGAGIRVQGNGAISLSITNVDMSNNGDDVQTTGPTDSLQVAESTLSGTGHCVNIAGGTGAGTMAIRHNNLSCLGGAVRFNPTTFGNGIITDNEFEVNSTVTDANSAAFDFLSGAVYVSNNISTVHNHANFDFFVGNGVTFSQFYTNQGGGSNTDVFSVGTGAGNIYWNNITVGTTLFSNPSYTGVVSAPTSGTPSSGTVLSGTGVWVNAGASFGSQGDFYATANGSTNTFTPGWTFSAGLMQVFLNGVKQRPGGVDYTIIGSTVGFTNTPANGQLVEVIQ